MSKPKPIHTTHRPLRETPDEAEPSFSYEQESFLAQSVDDLEDEFDRRLHISNRRASGGNGNNNNHSSSSSNLQQIQQQQSLSSSLGGGGPGSFWRTIDGAPSPDAGVVSNGSSSVLSSSAPVSKGGGGLQMKAMPPPIPAPSSHSERQKSGGLLGAALQLHSQSSSLSDPRTSRNNGDTEHNHNSHSYRKSNSSMSEKSNSSGNRDKKKDVTKQRQEARRLKMDAQSEDVDIGHEVREVVMDLEAPFSSIPPDHPTLVDSHSHGSATTESSGGTSHRYSRGQPRSGGLFVGKSSSLIFPTGVDPPADAQGETSNLKKHKINVILDQCENVRFPFKKKLMLNNLKLSTADIPVKDLYGTSLGNSLHKLSLAGNRLGSIPSKLVTCLPVLKDIDFTQCELHHLPERWDLPLLKRLNLSHNHLTEFPEESMLEGLPELQTLNMYGNKVSAIVIPSKPKLLSKLEILDLGYNDLSSIPEDLDSLKSLKTLKVMNNFLEKIPMRVCDMRQLTTIDVSSNPVIQPPIETCERGICSMRRYYECLRVEEQSKQKALERLQNKAVHHQRKSSTKKAVMEKMKGLTKPMFTLQTSLGRKHSEDTTSHSGNEQASLASSKDSQATPKHGFAASSRGHPFLGGRSSGSGGAEQTPRKPDLKVPPQDKPIPTASSRDEAKERQLSNEPPSSVSINGIDSFGEQHASRSISTLSEVDTSQTDYLPQSDQVTVNDTLKVIFVGMAMAGKTSMIHRLIKGQNAVIPTRDERTIGVDIYEWDPKEDHRFEHIDSRIQLQDKELEETCGDVNVKFSVWDFAGQHVYHATHELFFSQRALFVLVWDMGATNPATQRQKGLADDKEHGAFKLSYDSSDEEEEKDDEFALEEEARRADRALERDIDEKVQFWVDCIQSSAPGAAILPVASFDDKFSDKDYEEAKRRCNIMKERLLKHEERRLHGIKSRLKEYEDQNRANDQGALRLRKLISPYARPKLIFGDTYDDSVVRVSGLNYTGFAPLTERIINIATGRDKCNRKYAIFRGHVGARIPRMRLEVREMVRMMRDRFKVVEWGYFINQLRDKGLHSIEDISDALHFLTNIGELSYFGSVLQDSHTSVSLPDGQSGTGPDSTGSVGNGDDDDISINSDDEDYADNANLSIDNTSITAPITDEGSSTLNGDSFSAGLSQFVFLNPRWLVAAVACILRHDLDREIQETRRSIAASGASSLPRGESFYEANLNCPVITSDDACMLWQAKRFTKKAAERVEEYSSNLQMKPFEFLQLLLTKFGVFVPIDLGIEKAFLGGREYSQRNLNFNDTTPSEIIIGSQNSSYFFLPSLLGPGEPAEAWGYKSTDSWKVTLCHSVLFPDGVPPGLMERITASVLSSVYAITNRNDAPLIEGTDGNPLATYEGKITLKEILCWRTAFFVKLGMQGITPSGDIRESIVEVFCGLVDRDSHLCVGSDYLGVGMRRLVTSAKGQEGDGGRKVWKGGYLLVCKAVQRVMEEYGGLEFEKQGFCPVCLSKKPVEQASSWDFTVIRSAVKNSESTMRCRHGHEVDTRLVAGPVDSLQPRKSILNQTSASEADTEVPLTELLPSIVLVGLWDGKSQKIIRIGSGFIADRKRGLIVTASHTLMNIYGEKTSPFGENYYGLRQGKVVIGVIPRGEGGKPGNEAVFRYFARIVAKDPSIEQKGECHIDACVLRITTRLENDVGGQGEGCGEQPEKLLLNNTHALKQEKLQQLAIRVGCELADKVRVIGYNQGGEGLLEPGQSLNRSVDFSRGYVRMLFNGEDKEGYLRHQFKPLKEIAVKCDTIGGHSGGPCVNQQGEVIGILSRADPAEKTRCYLVPTSEWKPLLKQAKYSLQ